MIDSAKNTELNTNSTPESNLDDYGYEQTGEPKTTEETKPTEETNSETKETKSATGYSEESKTEEENAKTSTGYGEEDAETEETKNDKPDEKAEIEEQIDFKEALDKLPENFDKDRIDKFAKEHKMTKEQVEAYVNLVKEDRETLINNEKAQIIATKKQWKEELYKDPEFGSDSKETFDKNLFEVDKVLDKFMPNLKKTLTDKGTMLPPYIMRDLLGISKILNPKTDLVNGEPSKPKSEEKSFLDEMYE